MTSALLRRARVMEAVQAIAALEQETLGDHCLFINLLPILNDLIEDVTPQTPTAEPEAAS